MLKTVLDLVIPHRCFGCNKLGEGSVCNDCIDALALIEGNFCLKCGKPAQEPVKRCRECRRKQIHFDSARSLFIYEGIAEKIIKGFKYNGGRLIAEGLLNKFSERLGILSYVTDCDLITFIPSSVVKYLKRGYNPADEIAKTISKITAKTCINSIIFKRPISDQTNLDRIERSKNLKGAFKVIKQVKGLKVLLVDDVYTTGATSGQAALALKKAGAKEVNVFTLARRM